MSMVNLRREYNLRGIARYEVTLPWKESHAVLPTHYNLSVKRLTGLLRRLRQTPGILQQYDAVIRDQLERGIVEIVDDAESHTNLIHYLPHHPVVREDKACVSTSCIDFAADLKVFPLSDTILRGNPRLDVKRLKHRRKASTIMFGTMSRCTALTTQHVNKLTKLYQLSYSINQFILIFPYIIMLVCRRLLTTRLRSDRSYNIVT